MESNEDLELQELALNKRVSKRQKTLEEKRMIVRAHLLNHVPISQLSANFGVDKVTIWRWIRTFADGKVPDGRNQRTPDVKPNPSSMSKKSQKPVETEAEELARLREENKRLAEALKMSEWMNHAKDVIKIWCQTVKTLAAEKVKGQTMGLLCRLFGKSWQAYYQHKETLGKQRLTEEMVVQFVREIRLLDPGMGGEKLHYMYRERFGADYEYMVGRDKMEAIIARNGLNVRLPRRRPRTTDSTHGLPTYPNLVKELIPVRKNQLWVTDITYIPIWNPDGSYSFCYLSMITDCYTKEIISWYVGETMEAWCSVECLMQALDTLPEDEVVDLIHHSDRGIQYVSAAYTSLLVEARIKISMTESGDPKDNAVAERQNNTVKNELLKDIRFHSIGEARRAMAKAVVFYNNERPHMSLNNMTPRQAASCKGKIQKKRISYREKYLENLEIQEGACTFAPQTLNMIERLSAEPVQQKQGLRENDSTSARNKD